MKEAEEAMIGLMRAINLHLEHIASSLEIIEGRLADLTDVMAPEEDDDDADRRA